MSFGYSVSDFIAIGQLTWAVYRACKGAPGEFQELSRELSTLHTILHELEDEAKTSSSLLNRRGAGRKQELDTLIQNLSDVLKQIEDIVNRYHSLGRDQKRAWDRVKFATEDLVDLRGKLIFHVSGINTFMSSLSASSLARIEGILDELVKDIKDGKKEPSVISTHDDNDKAAWDELERELIGDGITKQDVEKYKVDIKEYLLKLVQENLGTGFALDDNGNSSIVSRERQHLPGADQSGNDMTEGVIISVPYDSISADSMSPILVDYLPRLDQMSARPSKEEDELVQGFEVHNHEIPLVSLKTAFSLAAISRKAPVEIRNELLKVIYRIDMEHIFRVERRVLGRISVTFRCMPSRRYQAYKLSHSPLGSSMTEHQHWHIVELCLSVVKVRLLPITGIIISRVSGSQLRYQKMKDLILEKWAVSQKKVF